MRSSIPGDCRVSCCTEALAGRYSSPWSCSSGSQSQMHAPLGSSIASFTSMKLACLTMSQTFSMALLNFCINVSITSGRGSSSGLALSSFINLFRAIFTRACKCFSWAIASWGVEALQHRQFLSVGHSDSGERVRWVCQVHWIGGLSQAGLRWGGISFLSSIRHPIVLIAKNRMTLKFENCLLL